MGLVKKPLSRDRVEFSESISNSEINDVICNDDIRVLQTSSPVDLNSWRRINEQLIPKRPDIQIRIYGHYSSQCDLALLENIPDVKNLSVDCLMNVSNAERIGDLDSLKILSVGIFNLENFNFLERIPASLEKLFLGSTKSKKPTLSNLRRFTDLKELYIEGHNKDIEVVGQLESIEKLVLRSTSPKDISFLRNLRNLWSLDIKLGGIKDLSPLEGLENIKYLELWLVKGLSDISVISSMSGLEYLFLQALKNVDSFPDASRLVNLRRVYLDTMKGLTDISGLLKAPQLLEFIHVCAQNMQPAQYSELLGHQTLKRALFGFGSERKNNVMRKLMISKSIEPYKHETFVFSNSKEG